MTERSIESKPTGRALGPIALLGLLLAAPAALAAPAGQGPASAQAEHGEWLEPVTVDGRLDGKEVAGEVRVYLPAGYRDKTAADRRYPLVLALHGWNHSPALFIEKAGLEALADRHQVVVAIPDTGRTVFETSFYKETRGKWTKAPGARWVGEVVLPHLRERFRVAADRKQTAVIGYSTGGRGAVLLAELYGQFGFVGTVSGTYDLGALDAKSGEYAIHNTIYGSRDKFPERWTRDNVVTKANLDKLAGIHLYVAHGDKEKPVPFEQMLIFQKAVAKVPLASKAFVVTKDGEHNWQLWNKHWPAMFEGFAKSMSGGGEAQPSRSN
jgi:S-formylglutathione hydrolase FrmB